MTKHGKILEKAINNPSGLSFSDFETLLEQCQWLFRRQTGSHRLWKAPNGTVLPIQSDKGKAKEYQVKQFFRIMESINERTI